METIPTFRVGDKIKVIHPNSVERACTEPVHAVIYKIIGHPEYEDGIQPSMSNPGTGQIWVRCAYMLPSLRGWDRIWKKPLTVYK